MIFLHFAVNKCHVVPLMSVYEPQTIGTQVLTCARCRICRLLARESILMMKNYLNTWGDAQLVVEATLGSSQRRLYTSARPENCDVLELCFSCMWEVASYKIHFTIVKVFHLKTELSIAIFVDENRPRNSCKI